MTFWHRKFGIHRGIVSIAQRYILVRNTTRSCPDCYALQIIDDLIIGHVPCLILDIQ